MYSVIFICNPGFCIIKLTFTDGRRRETETFVATKCEKGEEQLEAVVGLTPVPHVQS